MREPDVVSYVWRATGDLPALGGTDLGAVLTVQPADPGYPDIKQVTGDATVEAVRVQGERALWIPGDHVVLGPDGTSTKAQRVLLWLAGDKQYRLETNIERDRAVALAERGGGNPRPLSGVTGATPSS